MTTDDFVRLGLNQFLSACRDEWDRDAPIVLSTDPAGIELEAARQLIERRHREERRNSHVQTATTQASTDASAQTCTAGEAH